MDRGTRVRAVGSTRIAEVNWSAPSGIRSHEQTVPVGHGAEAWRLATAEVLHWGVKTRSGFIVRPDAGTDLRVAEDRDYTLVARVGPLGIREPVRVLAVLDLPDRCGFAYGTRPGHPVAGEEAFIVHRDVDGRVWFTQRSLTQPGLGPWRLAFPAVLVAQRWYRRRYARALTGILTDGG
ncbi:DUF1990 family protein [Nostocoides sp. HKS02]|nr:DUF1990 family protein [Tetrasphaera sp. HKS02]